MNARTVLEVGTLGGYSTMWLARGLGPEGRIVTLELDAHHAQVARENLAHAGLADRVEVRVGPAVETLATLVDERFGPSTSRSSTRTRRTTSTTSTRRSRCHDPGV